MTRLTAVLATVALAAGTVITLPPSAVPPAHAAEQWTWDSPQITWDGDTSRPEAGTTIRFQVPKPQINGSVNDPAYYTVYGLVYGLAATVERCVNIGLPSANTTGRYEDLQRYSWSVNHETGVILGSVPPALQGLNHGYHRGAYPGSFETTDEMVGAVPCVWSTAETYTRYSNDAPNRTYMTTKAYGPSVKERAPLREPLIPATPYLLDDSRVYPGGTVTAVGLFSRPPMLDESVGDRRLDFTIQDVPANTACLSGVPTVSRVTTQAAGSIYGIFTIPADAAGKYLCVRQHHETGSQPRMAEWSDVLNLQIPASAAQQARPLPSLNVSLTRLNAATSRLAGLLLEPQLDQDAVAEATAETEAARREAEAAAARAEQQNNQNNAGQGNQNNAGQGAAIATPAEIAAAQAQIEEATTQVAAALGTAAVGTGTSARPVSSLVAATGFDPRATPILGANKKNASGVSITVKAPDSAKQRKRMYTKLVVNQPVTRGGMRQYFLALDGDEPELLLKRTGFVPKGEKNKRFWISRKFSAGTYGLLTTFKPSTPGMEGVAFYQTIEVLDNPKKKKKKKKKKNR